VAALGTLASQSRVQLEHWRDSETLFRHALAITEKNHIAHTQLAEALLQRGRMAEAVPHLRSALKFDRENLDALNNLAWALATDATSSRDEVREAESLALHAARMAPDDPNVLDTLAVAHARGGDYSRARAAAERALTLAKQSGNQSLVGILNERLARFRAGRPYTEGP
jgi:Flp pilus assembly protein TadD